jgi:hypothetical protein
MAQMVKHLPSNYEALNSNLQNYKGGERERKKEKVREILKM